MVLLCLKIAWSNARHLFVPKYVARIPKFQKTKLKIKLMELKIQKLKNIFFPSKKTRFCYNDEWLLRRFWLPEELQIHAYCGFCPPLFLALLSSFSLLSSFVQFLPQRRKLYKHHGNKVILQRQRSIDLSVQIFLIF